MPSAGLRLGLASLALASACGHSRERDRVDFERMRLQQRYDLYGASGVFPNRAELQAPPAGTVSRETLADTGVVGTGTSGGRAVAAIPIALSATDSATGAKMFGIYCAVCHGSAGYGGSTVAENMGPPRPPSLHSARLLAAPLGYIYGVATRGLGRMPSYASQLTTRERWAVVAYVKQLQTTPTIAPHAVDDSLRGLGIQQSDSAETAARRKS
jgi:mono/diheme cytochrome c family protein